MNKCHVCKEKAAEFKNRETGDEVCETCMETEVAATKAASMTVPTYEAIAIEAEPAEPATSEALPANEPVEGAEVVDDKKEQNFNLRDVPPEIEKIEVKCIHCGKTGHAGDIEDNCGVRYAWHNLPVDINSDADPEAVCLKCAKEHDGKHKKRLQRWFQKHRTLPVLPYTLMAKAAADEKRQALMDKARQWGKDRGIEYTPDRVCSVCGATHGELVETFQPYYHFLVLEVSTVVGTPANRQDMLSKAMLCRDCRFEAINQAKAHNVRLQLRSFDEMSEEFDRRDRLNKVMGQGVEQRYEPLGQKGDGRRQKRDQWKKTGTDRR